MLNGLLKKLRKKNSDEFTGDIVTDLDKLIAEPVAFRLNGSTFVVRPLSTAEFMAASEALAHIERLRTKKDGITSDELVSAYADIFHAVCPEMNKQIVLGMTQAQIGALFQMVLECVTGKIHAQKKTPQDMTMTQTLNQKPKKKSSRGSI